MEVWKHAHIFLSRQSRSKLFPILLAASTMVFTAQQLTAFFEAADQMAIPAATRAQLQTEGITTVDDLSEFKEADLKQISENLRRPSGRIPDPAPNAQPGAMIPQPPFVLGAKSITRLTGCSRRVGSILRDCCSPIDPVQYEMGTSGQELHGPLESFDRKKEGRQPGHAQNHP